MTQSLKIPLGTIPKISDSIRKATNMINCTPSPPPLERHKRIELTENPQEHQKTEKFATCKIHKS